VISARKYCQLLHIYDRPVMSRLVLFVMVLGMGVLMNVTEASACSANAGEHCYSVVNWNMNEPEGEEVYGAQAELETFYGDVPRWEYGDFITNELWVAFANGNEWIEGGAVIGNRLNATTPNYFVAREYGADKYLEFDYPGEGPGYYAWYGLYLDEPHGANGEWCATWGWETAPDYCFAGFWTASDELSTGMEFGTTTASGADNNGQSLGWALWTNWTWHEQWEGAYAKAEPSWNPPLCISAPSPGHNYGSVAFAVPGC
jgi:hypothetical protein